MAPSPIRLKNIFPLLYVSKSCIWIQLSRGPHKLRLWSRSRALLQLHVTQQETVLDRVQNLQIRWR